MISETCMLGRLHSLAAHHERCRPVSDCLDLRRTYIEVNGSGDGEVGGRDKFHFPGDPLHIHIQDDQCLQHR